MIRISTPSIRGFTLVELMVSIAIFITVITIATGALFSAQAVNVRLEQTQIILDEVNLATEMMARDIRYGTTFYCDVVLPEGAAPTIRKSCAYPNGGAVLVFRPAVILSGSTNQLNDRVAYYVSGGALYKKEYPAGGAATISQLTSSSIVINSLAFFVSGAQSTSGTNDWNNASDMNQPLTTIIISGTTLPPRAGTAPVSFNVETSASSREIDN